VKYPSDMDYECVPLCNALNAIPGIRTVESCCGHSKTEFMIWFVLHDRSKVRYLNVVARVFDRRYGGIPGWTCQLDNHDLPKDTPFFLVRSGSFRGAQACEHSKRIAENIYHHLKHKAFCRAFLGRSPHRLRRRVSSQGAATCSS